MRRILVATVLIATLAGCGAGAAEAGNAAEAEDRSAKTVSVAAATRIAVTLRDSLDSRVNKSGENVRAAVAADVKDGSDHVIIPAGSPVTLTIVKLEPGSDQVHPEGRLELATSSVVVNGNTIPLRASIGPIPHVMKGRGITKDEAGRIAAGTAVGAGIGQLIGKDTKSTVIGAAVGTVAGGAVAVKYAHRDVVVARGTRFTITLTQPLIVAN